MLTLAALLNHVANYNAMNVALLYMLASLIQGLIKPKGMSVSVYTVTVCTWRKMNNKAIKLKHC